MCLVKIHRSTMKVSESSQVRFRPKIAERRGENQPHLHRSHMKPAVDMVPGRSGLVASGMIALSDSVTGPAPGALDVGRHPSISSARSWRSAVGLAAIALTAAGAGAGASIVTLHEAARTTGGRFVFGHGRTTLCLVDEAALRLSYR